MIYHRRSIRLKGFDYANNGYYFVTICVQNKLKLFWKNDNKRADTGVRPYIYENNLNNVGKMILKIWNEIPNNYVGIEIDEFCVMPNHVHGILIINNVGVDPCVDLNKINKLGIIIKNFKTLTTKIFIDNVKQNNWPKFNKRIWQRNYYERIIRNEKEYLKIKEYIKNNPKMWDRDRNNCG